MQRIQKCSFALEEQAILGEVSPGIGVRILADNYKNIYFFEAPVIEGKDYHKKLAKKET